jgi:hypothetical protein
MFNDRKLKSGEYALSVLIRAPRRYRPPRGKSQASPSILLQIPQRVELPQVHALRVQDA